MLVFIDDSGDPGFKLARGSSRFFVISAVLFHDNLEAEKTALAIKELRRTLGFPDGVEFKFNKSNKEVRCQFLQTVRPFDFAVRSMVVDKKRIRSEELKTNRNSFYGYIIKMLLQHSNEAILDANIKIDGNGDRVFRKSFLMYLRRSLNSSERKVMKRCKLVNSRGNVLIQMADMVAGSIRRSYDGSKTDHALYKGIIGKNIQDEWNFR